MNFLTKHSTANNPVLKIVTAILFITFPIIGFVLGVQFGKLSTSEVVINNKKNNGVEQNNWLKTTTAGGGVTFKYPKNWHVVVDGQVPNKPLGYRLIFIGKEPFDISTTHGPTSDFIISVQNGLPKPQIEFNRLLSEEKKQLEAVSEEVFSSKYFEKIYHIKGKTAGGGFGGGREIEKYFLMQTNPKYFPNDPDGSNINIIIAELNQELQIKNTETQAILKNIVMNFKECHFTWCENE